MQKTELEQLAKYEKTYWWHVGKKYMVESLLKDYTTENKPIKILEIGCGVGAITKMLQKYGEVFATDIAEEALAACAEKGVKNLVRGDFAKLDIPEWQEKFDYIFALDVLEHIQDDVGAIRKVHSFLKRNGKFIITVPAYKFLWSSHDEALEHKRRYTTYEIKTKLLDNGFKVEKTTHFVFFSFPGIAFFKFLSNFLSRNAYSKNSYIPLPPVLNNIMIWVLKLETKIMKKIALPFGTTIVVVSEK